MNESPATQKALTGAKVVRRLGVEPEPTPPPSPHRFPDGAHFRIEIPSVEGPRRWALLSTPRIVLGSSSTAFPRAVGPCSWRSGN